MKSISSAARRRGRVVICDLPLAGLLLGLAVLLAGAPLLDADPPPSPPAPHARSAPASAPRLRLREGSQLVDRVGSFQMVGDRLVFSLEPDGAPLIGLENLCLERVARSVSSHPESLRWKVTGTITEYQGTNYLLIERAMLKSEPPPR